MLRRGDFRSCRPACSALTKATAKPPAFDVDLHGRLPLHMCVLPVFCQTECCQYFVKLNAAFSAASPG